MLESGIYVRDFGTRLEEIDWENSGNRLKWLMVENEKASQALMKYYYKCETKMPRGRGLLV